MKRSWYVLSISILSIIINFSPGHCANWEIETVHAPRIFTGMTHKNIGIDSAGTLHIAYGFDRLYHAWKVGNDWETEVVDASPGSGMEACLGFGQDGLLHIGYINIFDSQLKYAVLKDGTWDVELVAESVSARYLSIDFSASNKPYIAYYDDITGKTKLAYREVNGTWGRMTVMTGINVADMDMAFGSTGPHIAYIEDDLVLSLRYVYWDGSEWDHLFVSQGRTGVSLVVDDQDFAHISFMGDPTGDLRYMKFQPSVGPGGTDIVDPLTGSGVFASLALDATGNPHICYSRFASDWILIYASQVGGIWHLEEDLVQDSNGMFCSLALDSSGLPHISSLKGKTGTDSLVLEHIFHNGVSWNHEDVDKTEEADDIAGFILDPSGEPRILYTQSHKPECYWAWDSGGAWDHEPVPLGLANSISLGLAFSPNGNPQMIVLDPILKNLMHYELLDDSWIGVVIEPILTDRVTASFKVDSSGNPHLVYIDHDIGDLKYAYYQGSEWHIETIEPGMIVSYPSLAIDSNDIPCISYYDHDSNVLRYADRPNGSWRKGTVDPGQDAGRFSSLAIDSMDRPHISYFDGDSGFLKYAYHNGTSWVKETVDSNESVGRYTSLVLDRSDYPHISYTGDGNLNLHYAFYDGLFWQIETIVSLSYIPHISPIVLDSSDNVMIAFEDDDLGDLLFAKRQPEIYCYLSMEDTSLQPGKTFLLESHAGNLSGESKTVDEYVILDVYGAYWFWPGWSQTLDFRTSTLNLGPRFAETILEFPWPEGAGNAEGIRFWTALFTSGSSGDLLDYDVIKWGFSE